MPEEQDIRISPALDSTRSLAGLPSRYISKGVLAQGGMGVVYRAFDLTLEREVAIKILMLTDASNIKELKDRFTREAKVLASLDHPNIVKLFDWGETAEGHPFLSMELLEGVPLSCEIGKGKRLSLARFHAVCSAVLAGLQQAHSLGIVHRDLKPSNIMISSAAQGLVVKLIDFGLVRFDSDEASAAGDLTVTVTATNDRLGSPAYMSPEQCLGHAASKLSDLYSFSCVLFECLSGVHPFASDSVFEYMQKHVNSLPPNLVPKPFCAEGQALAALVEKGLSKDPRQRPQSALELRESIDRIFENKHTEFCTFSLPGSLLAEKQAFRAKPVLLLLAFVSVCGLAALFLISKQQQQSALESVPLNINRSSDSAQNDERLLKDASALAARWRQRFKSSKTAEEKAKTAEVLIDKLMELSHKQRDLHHYKIAQNQLLEVVELCQIIGPDADGRKAICLGDMISVKRNLGYPREANKYALQAQGLAASIWGESHWRTLFISYELISNEIEMKDLALVEPQLQRFLAFYSFQPRVSNVGIKHRNLETGVDRVKALRDTLKDLKALSPDQENQRKKLLAMVEEWLKTYA